MPKQWKLITLYIIFIYCVLVVIIEYTKRHPIADERPVAPSEAPNVLDSGEKAQ